MSTEFPYKIQPFTEEDNKKLQKTQKSFEYVFVGPQKYVFLADYADQTAHIYNMPLRTTDTFIVTFPRSGTTWAQEMVWLIANDLDYERAKSVSLTRRFPFLENVEINSMVITKEHREEMKRQASKDPELMKIFEEMSTPVHEILKKAPSPRFIKSHMPLSLLPPSLLSTAKVVYVARDPRDVVVSHYHFYKDFSLSNTTHSFEDFFDMFSTGLIVYGPLFSHIKEAWALRDHPNMLFIFYEDMIKDLNGVAHRVSRFLNKSYSEEQITKLCDHLTFDNFKNNASVDLQDLRKIGGIEEGNKIFIRKGKAGGWRDYFTGELEARAQMWIDDNLRDTDLCFPTT